MRQDIQCLRGIAILFVLSFHLAPTLFVNGFLGVDIFFVVSGFLMAKCLINLDLLCIHNFLLFYYKRFRRILPLYFLAVFMIVVMVHVYLPEFLWKNNNRYSLASLFFVTNQLVIHDQADYFDEFFSTISSTNAFLHLWSLSVEMQFYLFVPFVFFGLHFLKNDILKLIAVSIMTVVGFIAFFLVNDKFAFNFMFLRLWQFSSGFTALFWSRIGASPESLKPNETDDRSTKSPITKEDSATVVLSILFCCLLPIRINVEMLRPIITTSTALLIACNPENVELLKSRNLAYIGDISYVMYLVHWPVIAIFLGSTGRSYLFCILITLFSSVILHHLYEKRYLKKDWKTLISFLVSLILCNSVLQYSVREHDFWKSSYPEDVRDIIIKNQAMLPYSWTNDSIARECTEDPQAELFDNGVKFAYGSCPGGNGNTSVMIIGNSYSLNLRDSVRKHFNNNYSEFRYVSLSQGYGIYSDPTDVSSAVLSIFRKRVEIYKPDVLFILAKYSSTIWGLIKDNDEYLNQMNENIAFYEQFAMKIYILGSHPVYRSNFANQLLQYVINSPEDIGYLHLNKREADNQMKYVKKRFSMVNCTKCHFFDLSHVFLDNSKYLTFDRETMLSYVDNTAHLSIAGVNLCSPVFERIVKEAVSTL